MPRAFNLYAHLFSDQSLPDILHDECTLSINEKDSGFDKTVKLISSRHRLLLLSCALTEFLYANNLQGEFLFFCASPDDPSKVLKL